MQRCWLLLSAVARGRSGELKLLAVGGGGEVVRREVCRGAEQDGERGKPDGDNEISVGGACSQLRRSVTWMC